MAAEYITAAQAATRCGVTHARLLQLLAAGRVRGAIKFGKVWMVPVPIKITPGRRGPAGIARG